MTSPPSHPARRSLYFRIPLYIKIMVGLTLGVALGYAWNPLIVNTLHGPQVSAIKPFGDVVLQLLRLLATPLIFVAVVQAIMKAKSGSTKPGKLAWLLLSNTTVAILIGLLVANTLHPGNGANLNQPTTAASAPATSQAATTPATTSAPALRKFDAAGQLLSKIPSNLIDGFQQNEIITIIIIAVALGIALRIVRTRQQLAGEVTPGMRIIEGLLDIAFDVIMVMLHWLFELVPFAVFAVVTRTVSVYGAKSLGPVAYFALAVIIALFLQAGFYLLRLRLGSWVTPGKFLRGAIDPLVMAFSTASSAATLPVTFRCVREKIGVSEEAASMGVMVGGTFNHDGTALYEAMAALFISQAIALHLTLGQQILTVFMAILASVGAAGIPEAGLVTMMAVFTALNLPIEYIPLLLPLDWFLDRIRTAINVMGDMSVTCLLEGKNKPRQS